MASTLVKGNANPPRRAVAFSPYRSTFPRAASSTTERLIFGVNGDFRIVSLEFQLASGEPWVGRIRGLRANASAKSHAALNDSSELDEGNAVELGLQYRRLAGKLGRLNVLGGCCGTDHRHVEEICKACLTQ